MQYIIDFIGSLSDMLKSIWDFFLSTLDNLMMLFDYLGIVAQLCYDLIDSLPSWLKSFGLLTVLVSVLYMILGRPTGGSKE